MFRTSRPLKLTVSCAPQLYIYHKYLSTSGAICTFIGAHSASQQPQLSAVLQTFAFIHTEIRLLLITTQTPHGIPSAFRVVSFFGLPSHHRKKKLRKNRNRARRRHTHASAPKKKEEKAATCRKQQKSSPSNAPRKTEAAATAKFREGEPNASESHLRLAVAARNRSRRLRSHRENSAQHPVLWLKGNKLERGCYDSLWNFMLRWV